MHPLPLTFRFQLSCGETILSAASRVNLESAMRVPQTQSAFHLRAQRNAFRRRDARQRFRLFFHAKIVSIPNKSGAFYSFLLFWKLGRAVSFAMGLAVFSHFLLVPPVHLKDLAIYPHSSIHLGLGLSQVSRMTYWCLQPGVILVLLAIYLLSARRLRVAGKPVLPNCALVVGWRAVLISK